MLWASHEPGRILVARGRDHRPLVVQNAAKDKRPFIHPLLAPDGVGCLTEDVPSHHPWQHGLYIGLNDVNGNGFWTEGLLKGHEAQDGTFHPEPLSPATLDGDAARWSVHTTYRAAGGEDLLRETQQWTLRDAGATYTLELDWTLEAIVDLHFGQYAYGGLFIRMPFRREAGGSILTSEGITSHEQAEAQRARWIGLSMTLPDRPTPAGLAIFDHPENPEHPVPWRVDHELGIAPSRCIAGGWELERGARARFRHAVFAFVGAVEKTRIEAAYQRFICGAETA